MSPSKPDPAGLVYGFPVPPPQPAPEAPPVLDDRSRSGGNNHCCPVWKRLTMPRPGSSPERAKRTFEACVVALMGAVVLGFILYLAIAAFTDDMYPRLFVSGMSVSSFDVSPPQSHQLNGTWHIDFSLRYKNLIRGSFSWDGAAVSVYYKGVYLAGTDLHALSATWKPIPLEANFDASQTDVPGWVASDLADARRHGSVELDVQFLAKDDAYRDTFLCKSLRLGFSRTEEAKLIRDSKVKCPLIA